MLGTVENHGKMVKKTHGKDVAVYKSQCPIFMTINTCSTRFLSVKFGCCGGLTNEYWLTLHSASTEFPRTDKYRTASSESELGELLPT